MDFLNSLTLAQAGPVFNFANPGNTANAPDLNLVNNIYAIPEPSTSTLLLLALPAGLGWVACRRRR